MGARSGKFLANRGHSVLRVPVWGRSPGGRDAPGSSLQTPSNRGHSSFPMATSRSRPACGFPAIRAVGTLPLGAYLSPTVLVPATLLPRTQHQSGYEPRCRQRVRCHHSLDRGALTLRLPRTPPPSPRDLLLNSLQEFERRRVRATQALLRRRAPPGHNMSRWLFPPRVSIATSIRSPRSGTRPASAGVQVLSR